jgi:hypothetical protein
MTSRFVVQPQAEDDLASTFRWYEGKSWGLGTEFLRAVDVCFANVRRAPASYQEVEVGVRRARLRRFSIRSTTFWMSTAWRCWPACIGDGIPRNGCVGSDVYRAHGHWRARTFEKEAVD